MSKPTNDVIPVVRRALLACIIACLPLSVSGSAFGEDRKVDNVQKTATTTPVHYSLLTTTPTLPLETWTTTPVPTMPTTPAPSKKCGGSFCNHKGEPEVRVWAPIVAIAGLGAAAGGVAAGVAAANQHPTTSKSAARQHDQQLNFTGTSKPNVRQRSMPDTRLTTSPHAEAITTAHMLVHKAEGHSLPATTTAMMAKAQIKSVPEGHSEFAATTTGLVRRSGGKSTIPFLRQEANTRLQPTSHSPAPRVTSTLQMSNSREANNQLPASSPTSLPRVTSTAQILNAREANTQLPPTSPTSLPRVTSTAQILNSREATTRLPPTSRTPPSRVTSRPLISQASSALQATTRLTPTGHNPPPQVTSTPQIALAAPTLQIGLPLNMTQTRPVPQVGQSALAPQASTSPPAPMVAIATVAPNATGAVQNIVGAVSTMDTLSTRTTVAPSNANSNPLSTEPPSILIRAASSASLASTTAPPSLQIGERSASGALPGMLARPQPTNAPSDFVTWAWVITGVVAVGSCALLIVSAFICIYSNTERSRAKETRRCCPVHPDSESSEASTPSNMSDSRACPPTPQWQLSASPYPSDVEDSPLLPEGAALPKFWTWLKKW